MGEHDSEEAKVARALIFRELGPVHLGEDTVVLHGAEAQHLVLQRAAGAPEVYLAALPRARSLRARYTRFGAHPNHDTEAQRTFRLIHVPSGVFTISEAITSLAVAFCSAGVNRGVS